MQTPTDAITCTSCSQASPPSARFCGHCGEHLPPVTRSHVPEKGSPPADRFINTLAIASFLIVVWLGIGFVVAGNKRTRPGPQPEVEVKREPTLQDYLALVNEGLEKNLNQLKNPLAQRIESMHPTVKFKKASVKSIRAITRDGTASLGLNYRNVSEVHFIVTGYWEGWIEKTGFTEIGGVYDVQAQQMKETKCLNSNATLNLETIDWVGIGIELAKVVAAASL